MNRKQQLVTAVLGLAIVGSVAFMPVNAERKEPKATAASAVRTSGMIASAPANSQELPQDQVRDLTYN